MPEHKTTGGWLRLPPPPDMQSSAPWDGRPVLLGHIGFGERWATAGRWHFEDQQWREMNSDSRALAPSHWQPMPEGPTYAD